MTSSQKVNVFVSYSHVDKPWLERLQVHLKPLERKGKIELWSDKKIDPGKKWKAEIEKVLKGSVVAILLVSADFLASDFINADELPPLLAAAAKEETVILPVIIGHCAFVENEDLSVYQAVNTPDEPLECMTKAGQDAIFNGIHKSILKILKGRDDKKHGPAVVAPVEKIQASEQKRVAVIPQIKLRSQPIQGYSVEDVTIMLKDKGFFDRKRNTAAPGFPHKYEIQQEGEVVFDHTSGLMWQQSGSDRYINYKDAKKYVDLLNQGKHAGYNDWRLPTLEEAMSLVEPQQLNGDLYIDPLFGKRQQWIWTSDTYNASSAWVVDFDGGNCNDSDFASGVYVRAVR